MLNTSRESVRCIFNWLVCWLDMLLLGLLLLAGANLGASLQTKTDAGLMSPTHKRRSTAVVKVQYPMPLLEPALQT